MFRIILISLFFFVLHQTCFSQKIKIENYILLKYYYHGDSLISKGKLIEILKTDSLSANEIKKGETYYYISLIINTISVISSLYVIHEFKKHESNFLTTFKYGMIVSLCGFITGAIFEILSYESFNDSIIVYNENH